MKQLGRGGISVERWSKSVGEVAGQEHLSGIYGQGSWDQLVRIQAG